MAIELSTVVKVLNATTSREGTVVLLKRVDEFGAEAFAYDVTLHNPDGVDLDLFRKLKYVSASWVAEYTTDPEIVQHIAGKEKRKTVHEALALNSRLTPESMGTLREEDADSSSRLLVRALTTPLEDLLEKRALSNHARENGRILDEASGDQLKEWWAKNAEEFHERHRFYHRITERASWQGVMRLLPLMDDPNARLAMVFDTYSQRDRQLDWSRETWETIISLIPQSTKDPGLRTHRYAWDAPPLEWVRFMLGTTNNTDLRRYAVRQASHDMAYDPGIREATTASEYVEICLSKMPSMAERDSAEHAASKIVESGDIDAATHLAHNLDVPLRDDLADGVYTLALQRPAARQTLRAQIYALQHAMKRTESGHHTFPDAFRAQVADQGMDFFESMLRKKSNPFDTHPDHPFLLSLLDYLPGNIGDTGDIGPAGTIVHAFQDRQPDASASTWEMFLDMADGWEGTATELIETIEATM